MSIETLYRVQCGGCERYLAPETKSRDPRGCSRPAVTDSPATPLFLTFSSAYEAAVKRGWSAFPLVCPDCTPSPERTGP